MEGKPLNKSHFDLLNIGLNTHDQIDAYIAASESKVVTSIVRNQTGAALLKGTVVYISGASGNKPLVVKAQANSEVTSSKTFGIIKADIPDNQNGEAVFVGSLAGLDTLAYPEGTALWLSPSVAGGYTSTKPVAPNHAVFLGVVTRQHQNQGAIEVRIVNGYELEELHNVLITNPQNRQVIAYDSADQLYKNTTLEIADVNNLQTSLDSKQNILVSGTNIKTINSQSILGSGNIDIAGGGGATNLSYTASPTQGQVNSDTGTDAVIPATDGTNAGLFLPSEKSKLSGIASGATANSTDAQLRDRSTHTGTQLASTVSDFADTVRSTLLTGLTSLTGGVIAATDSILVALGKLQNQITGLSTSKQDTLVSGTNIKTLEGQSLLGSGDIDLTKSDVGLANVDNTSDLDKPISNTTQTALDAKQDTLVSGTNIKTVGNQSVVGSGDIFTVELDKVTFNSIADPATPDANKLESYAKNISGRMLPKVKGPSGLDFPLQPSFFQNNIMMLQTSAGTTIGTLGMTVTSVGTVSHPTATQQYGYMVNLVSAATAAATAGTGMSATSLFRGSTAGANGFFVNGRVALPDSSYNQSGASTGSRIFLGLTSGTMAAVVGLDNPAGSLCGFCRNHTDTGRQDNNWQFATKDGTTLNLVDTGMSFLPQKVYDFYIFCPPQGTTISYRIDNITDGTTVEGSTTTNLPANTTALRAGIQIQTVNAVARNIRFQRIYIESDR